MRTRSWYQALRAAARREAAPPENGSPEVFSPFDDLTIQGSAGSENVYFRMVTTYWEMVASFVVRGVLNGDLFLDSGGEMILVWTKLEPFVAQYRTAPGSDTFLVNVEKVVNSSSRAQDRVRKTRERLASRLRRPLRREREEGP
jgi:hypothetical protein